MSLLQSKVSVEVWAFLRDRTFLFSSQATGTAQKMMVLCPTGLAQVLPCLGKGFWEDTTPMETLQNSSPTSQRRISPCRRAQCVGGVCVNYPARVPHSWVGGWSFFSLPYITDLQTWLRSFVCLVLIEPWGLPLLPTLLHSRICAMAFICGDSGGSLIIGLILHSFPRKSRALGWQICCHAHVRGGSGGVSSTETSLLRSCSFQQWQMAAYRMYFK